MANSLDAFIPEIWANEAVALLIENMVMANLVHTDFNNEIASFGDTVNTRVPTEFTAERKTDADDVTVQNAVSTNIAVKLDQHFHTTFVIKDGEQTKSFQDLRQIYLEPAILSIARAIDRCLLGAVHQFHGNLVGNVGASSSDILNYLIDTRTKMNNLKVPEAGRNLIITPNTEAIMLKLDTFHEADKLGDSGTALREAMLGRKFGFDIYQCQNAPSQVNAPVTATTPVVDYTSGYSAGTTVVHFDTAGDQFAVGQWIMIDGHGPYQVTALGTLSTQDIDVTISPGLAYDVANDKACVIGDTGLVNLSAGYSAGYAKKIVVDGITGAIQVGSGVKFSTAGTPNVRLSGEYSVIAVENSGGNTIGITLNRPLDTAIAENDVVAFTPNGEYNFAFTRGALAMVTRPLAAAPAGLAMSAVANYGGVGIRVTITYNGTSQGTMVTVDLLFGLKQLNSSLGVPMIC